MKYIKVFEKFKVNYKEGDVVLIHYWYGHLITPVKLLEKNGIKWRISHDTPKSEIRNAPDEIIKSSEIIDLYRG